MTFSCYRKQALFPGRFAAAWLLEAIDAARLAEPFDLWAYVIMPDHVHIVLLPADGSRVSRILRLLKKPFADRVLLWARRNHPDFLERLASPHTDGRTSHHFWQAGGGYDRNLQSPREVHEKIWYVHANPVRKGLVEAPEDWTWSSYRAWTSEESGPIRLDLESVPPIVS